MRKAYVIKTLQGLESVLAEEAQQLGAEDIVIENRAVRCSGDQTVMYRLNYECRTALSVLTPILSGKTPDESSLYDLMRSIDWSRYFGLEKTFLIDMVCYSDRFRNTHFLALKCKDAIVDQFRDRFGKRPSISKECDIKINVFIKDDDCIISLDTSGASLFKRGYRFKRGIAPINEVLAAGLLYLSKWDMQTPLVDPMCGSGTFMMEGAMMARNMAAQKFRKEFSFMHLRDFDAEAWSLIRKRSQILERESPAPLLGMDMHRGVLESARFNALKAGLGEIKWENRNFFHWRPSGPPGVIIMNPPYDERISLGNAIEFYQRIGDHLKQECGGWKAWIISSHLQAVKRVGLKPIRRIPVFNGPLDCRFVGFDLY